MAKKWIPLRRRLTSFREGVERYFPDGISSEQKRRIAADFIREKCTHGTRFADYMKYEYYRYSSRARRDFITEQRRLVIDDVFNTKAGDRIFDEKKLFYQTFAEFVHRDWLDLDQASVEQFRAFTAKHPIFFGKPEAGSFGRGAGIFDLTNETEPEKRCDELRRGKMLVEELLSQHRELEEFHPTSVNTIRVVTVLRPNGEVAILSGILRIGRNGKETDNFHNDGIAALVDVETGVVYTGGVDRRNRRYLFHPDSGKRIIGFLVPSWEEIKSVVTRAAKVVPEVHYVGWDVAVGRKGEVTLIEGNCCADPDIAQMPDGVGKWRQFLPLLEEAKKAGQNHDQNQLHRRRGVG